MNDGVASMRQLNGFFASGLLVPDACRRGAIARPNSAQTRHITPIALSTQKIRTFSQFLINKMSSSSANPHLRMHIRNRKLAYC
jgi:hypothetical protein